MGEKIDIFIEFQYNGREIVGIDNFKKELSESYICQGKDADLPSCSEGGEIWFKIFIDIDFVQFIGGAIAGGIAWDLIKSGTKKYFLQPLINAIKKLETENKNHWGLNIQTMIFSFDDIEIVIGGINPNRISVVSKVFNEFFKHRIQIVEKIGFPIKQIKTPITYNTSSDGNITGPYYLNTDTELEIDDYLKIWQINYFRGDWAIYNLQDSMILETFN